MARFVPFTDRMHWLRRKLSGSANAQLGRWLDAPRDAALGEAVFAYFEPADVQIYALGLICNGERIRYDDIEDIAALSLPELMRAQHHVSQSQSITIKSQSGDVLLKLPLVQYASLWRLLMDVEGVVQRQPEFWGRISS